MWAWLSSDRVDVLGAERELAVAAVALGPMALEQAAVQQQGLAAGVDLVHRAGDGSGGAPEGDGRLGGRLALFGHEAIVSGSGAPGRISPIARYSIGDGPPTVPHPEPCHADLPPCPASWPTCRSPRSLRRCWQGRVELLPWNPPAERRRIGSTPSTPTAIRPWTRALLDRLPGLRVISNFGVGVDHIDVAAAAARGIPVGNTPGILDGATADLAFALLLAAGRRLVEGDRYARGPDFLHYDPSYMLGREIHGSTLGIIGMGRIGEQVARRARGFDMTVLYHNRQPPAGRGSKRWARGTSRGTNCWPPRITSC